MFTATVTGSPGTDAQEPADGRRDGAATHANWELRGFVLVCSDIYLGVQTADSRDESSGSALGPLLRRGLPTSGSDELNWNHVNHTGSPCDRWDNITLLTRERAREVEETREENLVVTASTRSSNPHLPPTGGNLERDAFNQRSSSAGESIFIGIRSTLALPLQERTGRGCRPRRKGSTHLHQITAGARGQVSRQHRKP